MADLALVTANRVEVVESIIQDTQVCAVDINAGDAVRYDSSGKWIKADATLAANARIYGVANYTKKAGEALTATRKGVLDGLNLDALAFDASVFLSNTAGRLADAAGTVSTTIGRVIPGQGQRLGSGRDKLLFVDL